MAFAACIATAGQAHMRRHHEELSTVTSMLPGLSLLIPFAGALWARIKFGKANSREGEGDL
jgi:hypothetical protein